MTRLIWRSWLARMLVLVDIALLQACSGLDSGLGSGVESAPPGSAAPNAAPPNIVLFLVDDLRWDELGYMGYPVPTPAIDQLAHEGIRFENAFVTSSLCSPSRASFLTGMYPHSHGVVGNTSDLDYESMPTIGKLLQDGGYYTAMIGKWHMGRNAAPRTGFDYWYALPGQGLYTNPRFDDNGLQITAEGYNTDILTKKAVEFLARRSNQPFYLHLSYKAVHGPLKASVKYQNSLERSSFESLQRPNARQQAVRMRKQRAETLRSVDDSVQMVVEYLKQHEMLDNTVLVFTSDNGFLLREHNRGDKRVFYDESIRIPWVMHYPNLGSPIKSVGEHILNIDFLPTMLDLAGIAIPDSVQGRSFAPLLKGGKATASNRSNPGWRDHWVYQYFNEEQFPQVPTHLAVVTEHYKYVHFPEGQGFLRYFTGEDLLFDRAADPYEMKSVAQSPEHEPLLQTMKKQLADFMETYDFKFYPLDEQRVNDRIDALYQDEDSNRMKRVIDRQYPNGYPAWVSPHSHYEHGGDNDLSAERDAIDRLRGVR